MLGPHCGIIDAEIRLARNWLHSAQLGPADHGAHQLSVTMAAMLGTRTWSPHCVCLLLANPPHDSLWWSSVAATQYRGQKSAVSTILGRMQRTVGARRPAQWALIVPEDYF